METKVFLCNTYKILKNLTTKELLMQVITQAEGGILRSSIPGSTTFD